MGQDVITLLAVCSFVLHSQAAIEIIPHLRISEQNRPMPVWRQLSLTHAGQGKLNPSGVGLTSLINAWNLEALPCHFTLHLYSTFRATLVPG